VKKPAESGKRRKRLNYILTILVLGGRRYYIYNNSSEISSYTFEFQWKLLFAAFLAAAGGYLMMFHVWQRLAGSFGLKASPANAAKAFFISQLGKYVPGKIGLLLVRINAYHGYSAKTVTLATGVEYITSFISACLMILLGTIFIDLPLPAFIRWLALGLVIALLSFLWPPILRRSVNFVFGLMKRQPIDRVPSYKHMLLFVALYVIVGLIYGFSLYLVFNSLSPVAFKYYPAITSTFWAAALLGIAAVFAPSGIGIREGVLMLILPAFIAEPTVIVGAILIRFVMIAAELFLAGLFTMRARFFRR